MLGKLLLGVALMALAPHGLARPASWFWWVSKASDHRVCAQASPGSGWFREPIAFRDSGCSIRVKPF